MLKVGQKVQFYPMEWVDGNGATDYKGEVVVGTIVMINEEHRWFSVEYGDKQRASFHFFDIGEQVTVLG